MSNIQSWKAVSRETVFSKYSRDIDKVVFKLPDGSHEDFYIRVQAPSAAVVGITSDQKVILVNQYRPGPNAILTELPGGVVDEGEDPAVAARREFIEETGYDGDFVYAGTYWDDAYSQMKRYVYTAVNCRKVGEPQQTPTEQIEVLLVSLEALRERLRSGELTDVGAGYLGLEKLGLLG